MREREDEVEEERVDDEVITVEELYYSLEDDDEYTEQIDEADAA